MGQYLTATFTADSTTQNVIYTSIDASGGETIVSGFQLRAAPEPSSIVCLALLERLEALCSASAWRIERLSVSRPPPLFRVILAFAGGFSMKQHVSPRARCPQHMAFTLMELLVTIAIVTVLVALSFGLTKSVQTRSASTKCLSNMKQVSTLMLLYTGEHQNMFPDRFYWDKTLADSWNGSADIFHCPSDILPRSAGNKLPLKSYSINPNLVNYQENGWPGVPGQTVNTGINVSAIQHPANMFFICEVHQVPVPFDMVIGVNGWSVSGGPGGNYMHHGNRTNVAFMDGHAESVIFDLKTWQPHVYNN